MSSSCTLSSPSRLHSGSGITLLCISHKLFSCVFTHYIPHIIIIANIGLHRTLYSEYLRASVFHIDVEQKSIGFCIYDFYPVQKSLLLT
jgi:hypothetical protein